jgi:serine/threonine-protein kinase RsbW
MILSEAKSMYKRLQIESLPNNLRIVEKVVDEVTSELGISQDNYGKIMVSTMEGVNNAILHGNKQMPDKYVKIIFKCDCEDLQVEISDEGEGFKPDEIPDPTLPENREELNGRGIFLMSHLADTIKYSKKGNAVTMTFKNIIT